MPGGRRKEPVRRLFLLACLLIAAKGVCGSTWKREFWCKILARVMIIKMRVGYGLLQGTILLATIAFVCRPELESCKMGLRSFDSPRIDIDCVGLLLHVLFKSREVLSSHISISGPYLCEAGHSGAPYWL